jgi:hypothetical protein
MIDNPIVEEVHRIREQTLAEFDGDMDAVVKDLQRQTEESAAAGRRVVASPPGISAVVSPESKKAG